MYIIIILIVICIIYFSPSEEIYSRSNSGKQFLVKKYNINIEKESANILEEIHVRILLLIDSLDNSSDYYWTKYLKQNYKRDGSSLSEAAIEKLYTTYTIDKRNIHVCLRTRDKNNKLYDINTLMFVIIHELGHVANYDKNENQIEGHGHEFINKFQIMLKESIKIGIYDYVDYYKTPQEYCGIVITKTVI